MRWLGPWSASSGAHSKARPRPVVSSTAAASETTPAPLFRNDVLKACPGEDRKDQVVQAQEAEVASGIVRQSRADAADDDRDRERQEEERQQQLSGPSGCGHRSEQRSDSRDPYICQRHGDDELPCHRLVEERERRKRDDRRERE